jgi:hypothetical protein
LLSGTPLLAEASLRGAWLSGTSLSGTLLQAGALLLGQCERIFVAARRSVPSLKKTKSHPHST